MKFSAAKSIALCFCVTLLMAPAAAQRTAVVRGVGTQTCKSFVEASTADKPFALLAAQWILGNATGYFRQTGDDPSRTVGDDLLVTAVREVCAKNADKTIDDALTMTINSLPQSEVQKPASK